MLKRLTTYFLLFSIFIASSWSLFHPGFFKVHDYVHGARIAEMYRGMAEGQFPVRWSENFGYGYGMPLYLFYAPLPYYVGALFYWLSVDLVVSVRLLYLLANLGTVVGGYYLGKKLFGTSGGILVSAAISLAPYRAVNLFVRGAVSEAWAIMFMPFILYFGLEILETKRQRDKETKSYTGMFAGLVLSVAGLMLSHNLTTLMFVPISYVFLISMFFIEKAQRLKDSKAQSLLTITGAYMIAGGLSAFYMIPAVMEKGYTQIDSILSGYFHYSHHFLYIRQFFNPTWGYGGSGWGPEDGISFFLGWGQLVALMVVSFLIARSVLVMKNRELKIKNVGIYILSASFLILSMYLSLLKSKWLWDIFPALPFIQFPWRWLSVGIIFLALLVGLGTHLVRTKKALRIYSLAAMLLLLLNAQYFQPESYLEDATSYYYSDEQLIREQMSGILPDYLPKDLQVSSQEAEGSSLLPRKEGELVRESDEVKSKLRELLVDKGHEKLLNVDLHEDTPLTFATAYFPGWKAEVDFKPVEIEKSAEGLIDVWVPKSKHTVAIYFGRTPVRVIADIVTVISFLLFLFIILPINHQQVNKK